MAIEFDLFEEKKKRFCFGLNRKKVIVRDIRVLT